MSRARVRLWVYRNLVRLYPADFRAEYGNDLIRLFLDLVSDLGARRAWMRTLRDLVATLPRYRLEALMSSSRSKAPIAVAAAATLLSSVWLAAAVTELSGGIGDTLRHWWSTLPAVALVLSLTGVVITAKRRPPAAAR